MKDLIEGSITGISERKGKKVKRLVLLPGMDGTGLLLKPFIDSLGGRLETHLLDYPTDVILS